MITKINLLITALFFSSMVFSQQKKVTGTWLLTKVVTKGKTQNPYFFVDYKANGKMTMRGMEVADWKREGNKIIQSSKIPDLNNEGKIIKLNSEEMVIKFPSNSLWFQRFDKEKLVQNSTFQSLLGVWKMQDTLDTYYLKFKNDLSFVMLQKNANSSISRLDNNTQMQGRWKFTSDNIYAVIVSGGNTNETLMTGTTGANYSETISNSTTYEVKETTNNNSSMIYHWNKLSPTQIEYVDNNQNHFVYTKN